jgi:hypothetical protein
MVARDLAKRTSGWKPGSIERDYRTKIGVSMTLGW